MRFPRARHSTIHATSRAREQWGADSGGASERSLASGVVALVGNPNCGKSTLFNALTGGSQPVGNWAGVTVELGLGTCTHAGCEFGLVDLPGAYSLAPSTADERITRNFVSSSNPTLLVNVIDASNLERNLYLTMQLVELGLPMIVALNMGDIALLDGRTVDASALSRVLGCPVVEVCASRRSGLDPLCEAIGAAADDPAVPTLRAQYHPMVDEALTTLAAVIEDDGTPAARARWIATKLFEYDEDFEDLVTPSVLAERTAAADRIESAVGEEPDILIADARYERIGQVVAECVAVRGRIGASLTERIDRIALHPRWGIPVFLFVMYTMFVLTITVGSAFIDVFDQFGALLFVDAPAWLMHSIGLPEAIVVLVANGIGGGMQSVATFIPPVGIMFLCLRFLEESGYMARAAFVMDRFMRALGLPGKAFVPMIVGFGCNVPAIMGARTLEHERDRKLAVALNPFMSCSARLPVYALFAAAFFPSSGQTIVFVLYLLGIAVAVLTGLVLKRTLLVGDLTPFVMELPPYHRPMLRSVLRGAWVRLRSFLVGAGRIIVPIVAALTILASIGTDGSFGHENTQDSALSEIGTTITPVFAPMGIGADNWPATVGIFTGIFAKEAVVGSLDALYSQLGQTGAATSTDDAFEPLVQARAAFATIPANLRAAAHDLVDPLGLSVGEIATTDAASAEQGVAVSTYTQMISRFDGQVGAFAYLVFVLLYMPCVAAIAAIYRETGRSWAIFVGCWTTGIAYGTATITYQMATFTDHPASSAAWTLTMLAAFWLAVRRMRRIGDDDEPPDTPGHPRTTSTIDAPTPRSGSCCSEASPTVSAYMRQAPPHASEPALVSTGDHDGSK
jgi:ferrous iron transport protein B